VKKTNDNKKLYTLSSQVPKKTEYILAIDQGTTSTRAILYNAAYENCGSAQREFAQHFPQSGFVEHEGEDLWRTSLETAQTAIKQAGIAPSQIAALGMTNQRETTLVWDRRTGQPIHRAIVWQDRRTSSFCARLRDEGVEDLIRGKTGLVLDPYFSASKIAWILDHVSGAREAASHGHLAFGTVDSWLIYKLTGGKRHVIDITNAARTMLCNIMKGRWDEELLALFDIPPAMMPEILPNIADFGATESAFFGRPIPILGVAGDQHAAMIGQACFDENMVKATYGTGCFALMNTGKQAVMSKNRLLTTIAYQLDGDIHYALEGAIFIAGAAVQWLRDGLGLIDDAAHSGTLAAKADGGQELYLVPAFTGLGAPWWEPQARGALYGLSRNSGPQEIAKATLESVCFQTRDLLDAMKGDAHHASILRVDGGMSASGWTMQRLADILDAPVECAATSEATALGAAWLAGYGAHIWPDSQEFSKSWQCSRRFTPQMTQSTRARRLQGWRAAINATLAFTHANEEANQDVNQDN